MAALVEQFDDAMQVCFQVIREVRRSIVSKRRLGQASDFIEEDRRFNVSYGTNDASKQSTSIKVA